MTIKITKQLATMEDLAIGTGAVVQERNGVPLTLTKIDLITASMLASENAGEGASLVSMEGGPTVESAVTTNSNDILDRVIRVTSIAAMEAYFAPVGYVFSLNAGGRSGTFDVLAGNFSTELAADTLNGIYVGLADNAAATTKVARRRIEGPLSIKWFGASVAVADNSASILATLVMADYLNASVLIPAGNYSCASRIVKTFTGSMTGTAIYGEGKDVSQLVFTGANGGLKITLQNNEAWDGTTLSIYHLTIKTSIVPATSGTALEVVGGHVEGGGHTGVLVQDVYITGSEAGVGWNTGFISDNSTQTLCKNVNFNGKAFDYQTSIGFIFKGANAPTDHAMVNCKAGGFGTAVRVDGAVEGVVLDGCVFVGGGYGVHWNTTGGEPWLTVANTHMNVSGYCIWIPDTAGLQGGFIHDCLLYELDNSDVEPDWRALFLRESFNVKVTNNVMQSFNTAGKTSRIAIDLQGCDRCLISGNSMRGTTSTEMAQGINLGDNCTNIKQLNNDYQYVTAPAFDDGTGNTVIDETGYYSAGGTINGNGNFNITVPHDLSRVPDINKVIFSVRSTSGSYDLIPSQVISVTITEVVVKVKADNFFTTGTAVVQALLTV